ncbi:hypothetical protein PVAND_010453 [Polypedilum vanderplanki]|uniref:Uncharacterized protein n=1 Tax=Polypedilum vanderplanki TaxID=319348 RepID=A0A9J6CGR6_POLVA|nr:hypothetical protein PVAND_010453 [Polypedilum vanderplanki]
MSKKEKRQMDSKKVGTSPDTTTFLYPSDEYGDISTEQFSTECYKCCCFDCNDLSGKINFSLDNLCCDLGPYPLMERPKKSKTTKKKKKKKSGTSSPNSEKPNFEAYDGKFTVQPKSFNLGPISDQLSQANRSFSTNDLPGFKGTSTLKSKKPKGSKKAAKLCTTIKTDAPASFKNLCSRFKSSSLTNLIPITRNETVKNLVNLSDHDKKILDRMSMKNLKEIALVENAMMARKYWEDEKLEREKLKNEQHIKYLKLVNERRKQEQAELARRRYLIEEKNKEMCEKIQNEIEAKMIRSENILKTLEMEREISEVRRKQREIQRIEAIHSNCEEKNLDEQLRREAINERLEEKIHKAENIRSKNLDVYRIRIQTDNQIHQQIHAQNYEEAIRDEIRKKAILKQKIEERDSKFKRFAEQRERTVQESKAQAKTSALLRELVRRSFGSFRLPSDASNHRKHGIENGRFSNCSYTSQVSHIHLS